MNKAPLFIGLAGYGTVGSGLAEVLHTNKACILRRLGREIRIKRVLERDQDKVKQSPFLDKSVEVSTDPTDLYNDPDIALVVELMGGIDFPSQVIKGALQAGKHVVTANKALLAEAGTELFDLAAQKGLSLGYEASVCGAIPIVQALRESLAGNEVINITGILNGTSNYILSEMSTKGMPFDEALAEAQALGYAEAVPTLDIEGIDAAHKLTLLIRLAYGVDYPFVKLPVSGIKGMDPMDIAFAREFGYRIKLVGQARNVSGRIEAGVFPTLVHHTQLMARVGGVYNAVRVEANAAGPIFMHGRGAGGVPTGSAVLADIMSVAREALPNNTGFVEQVLPPADIFPADEAVSQYYLRVMVPDKPGVLRDLAGCMAEEQVSVAQAIQKEQNPESVPIVFMTHEATAKAMRRSIAKMAERGLLLKEPVLFRVLGAGH